MSTKSDSILDASSIGGVSDKWLHSQAEAASIGSGSARSEHSGTSFRDLGSARSSHDPRPSTIFRYYPKSMNGNFNENNMADSQHRMVSPTVGRNVHQALQLPQALMHNGSLNFSLTGTLHPVAQQYENPSSQQDRAKYTMRLMEFGQTHSETPEYEYADQGFGTHNPLFTCYVTIRGVTAIGTGSKKRDAKHQASFHACQKLGL